MRLATAAYWTSKFQKSSSKHSALGDFLRASTSLNYIDGFVMLLSLIERVFNLVDLANRFSMASMTYKLLVTRLSLMSRYSSDPLSALALSDGSRARNASLRIPF